MPVSRFAFRVMDTLQRIVSSAGGGRSAGRNEGALNEGALNEGALDEGALVSTEVRTNGNHHVTEMNVGDVLADDHLGEWHSYDGKKKE